jgi:preprotein translocase subunit SecB
MTDSNLQQAIKHLRIAGLYVRDLVCKCCDDFDPKYSDVETLVVKSKYVVTKSDIVKIDEEQLFRVFVEVGIKWSQEEKSEVDYLAWIEAEYIAEYKITSELQKDCLDEFALKNVSYYVWPYWRELLASQCERMKLPRTLLPMTQVAHNHDADVEK